MKLVVALFVALSSAAAFAQTPGPQAPQAPQPFVVGPPLGTTTDGKTTKPSSNVKVFGSVVNAESCVYDARRKLILTINRGAAQTEVPNDAWVSLHNSDGSVHTPRWIGVNRNGLTLNQPLGSAINEGKLYLADSDGGTLAEPQRMAMVRVFDLETGRPAGQFPVAASQGLNGLAVAKDGTIYGSQTGTADGATVMRIYRIAPDGVVSVFAEGEPLSRPNGVAMDRDGNIVVVNMGTADVLTFAPDGKLVKTEQAMMSGNDGLVILPDGTKYVSSVVLGGVSRIKPGKKAELVASGIPAAASMCYDSGAKQLVIPMNANNSLAFVKVR